MRLFHYIALSILIAGTPLPGRANCFFNEEQNSYVRTTLSEEFQSAQMVVRAKVLGFENHWSNDAESWTIYRLKIIRSYKGATTRRLSFFTFRDSSGFYLETGKHRSNGVEYLLFLDSNPRTNSEPASAEGTVSVHYPCGMSKKWADVTSGEKQELGNLARK